MHDEIETIKLNEEIQQKYQKIGQRIPQYDNAKALFEGLLAQMAEEFVIPYIWLTFTHREELADLIDLLKHSKLLKDRLKILSEPLFLEIFENSSTSLLINEDLRPFYRLLPINVKYFIRSLAIAPIRINNQLMGSINCGDASSLRYQPGMDTALLDQLAGQVSDRLAAMIDFGKTAAPASGDAKETHKG
jgi:uncharacterized protein YigA (DUF484 family)